MKNNILNEAMILSAGFGKRMRYHTKFLAKPLLKLGKKNLLDINLKSLAKENIQTCILNTHYKHLTVKNFLKRYNYKYKHPKTFISHESQALETGGGVKKALKFFKQDSFFIINGDSILINSFKSSPIKILKNAFRPLEMDILLLLSEKKNSIGYDGYGDFSKIYRRTLAPIRRGTNPKQNKLVFTGWQIIKKSLFSNVKDNFFSLNLLYDIAQNEGRLYGITHNGKFLHLSSPKSKFLVENYMRLNRFEFT